MSRRYGTQGALRDPGLCYLAQFRAKMQKKRVDFARLRTTSNWFSTKKAQLQNAPGWPFFAHLIGRQQFSLPQRYRSVWARIFSRSESSRAGASASVSGGGSTGFRGRAM